MGVDRPIDITADQRKTILALLKRHLPNTTAWVYGSRVEWTASPQSDLDLVVFTKPDQNRRVSELREAFEESNLPFRVDLFVWDAVPEQFRKQIEADHAVLVAGNGDTVAESWIYRPQFPKHWKRRSLHAMAQWVNGLAFRNIQFNTTGRPVIKIAEIKEGISGQTKFTQQTFDESVRISSGDLLFSWSGQPETSIDAFWWRGPEGWLNQHIFRVSPINGIGNTFFYYLLRYLKPNFVAIARNRQTTGLGHVTRRDLENIEVAHPDPSEQRAIAHVLGTLDDKIELNRRMNETLEAMAQALFKSWFIDFDPVRAKAALRNHSPLEGESARQGREPADEPVGGGESVGHPPPHQPSPVGSTSATPPQEPVLSVSKEGNDWTVERARAYLDSMDAEIAALFPDRLVDSELGPIPEGWEAIPLSEIIEVNPTRPLQKGEIAPYLDMANMPTRGHAPDMVLDRPVGSGMRFVNGDTLVARITPCLENGKTAYIDFLKDGEVGWGSTEYIVMRPKPPLPNEFAYCLARSTGFREFAIQSMTGTSGRQRVPAIALSQFLLPSPTKQIAVIFGRVAQSLFARASEVVRESRTLTALRDTLLPRLVSGEIRTSNVSKGIVQ